MRFYKVEEYRLSFDDPDSRWFTSRRDAEKYAWEIEKETEQPCIEEHDIPTTKRGLLSWLNAYVN